MYSETAGLYDRLTDDIDYKAYAEYFSDIFSRWLKNQPHNIMDIGCGTGSLTLAMGEKGYDMTGIDASSEMLSVAYAKKGPGVLWINQNVTELDLFGTYDAAVSLMDCVNHILDERSLKKYFALMHNYIEPGGLFVFDINSEFKFRNVYAGNVFYTVEDDFSYIWQNNFNGSTGICTMDMTFFYKDDSLYKRFDTINEEKAYSTEYLTGMLEKAGFDVEALYDDRTFDDPGEESERIFFVCRRNL